MFSNSHPSLIPIPWRIPALATSMAAIAVTLPCGAQTRIQLPCGGSNWVPQQSLVTGLVTQDMATGGQTPVSIVQALVGPGVTITNIQFDSVPIAAGTFTGGTGIVSFAQGVVRHAAADARALAMRSRAAQNGRTIPP